MAMADTILSLSGLVVEAGKAIYEAATMSPEEQDAVKEWADGKTNELRGVRAAHKSEHDKLTAETRAVIAGETPTEEITRLRKRVAELEAAKVPGGSSER